MVLEKKTKEILYNWATARNWDEMSSESNIKDGRSRVPKHFFICLHPFPLTRLSQPESREAAPEPARVLFSAASSAGPSGLPAALIHG